MMAANEIERYDHLGRAHPGGVPTFVDHKTSILRPDLYAGENREFITRVKANETNYDVRIVPNDDFIGPVPIGFYPAEIYSRIPSEWPKHSEEEQPWGEPIDTEALLPSGEEAELLRVNEILLASLDEPLEARGKGIRSKKLWMYLGGAAAAGVVVGLTGIVVRKHKHKNT